MNKSLSKFFNNILEVSFLIPEQLITRAVVNITSMTVNVAGNALVICILIKTEQLSNITFKLIFSLITSDMLMTLTCQSLLAVILHEKYACSFKVAFTFLSVFFSTILEATSLCYLVLIVTSESNIILTLEEFGLRKLQQH